MIKDIDRASAEPHEKDTVSNMDDKAGLFIEVKPPFAGFGMLCCILSGVVFSFNALIVKLIKSNSAIQLSASRCIVQYLFLVPYATYNWKYKSHDITGPPGMFKFLLLRSLTGSTAAICLYQSVQRISLGDAVTLSFSNVIFAGILSYFLLKESFTVLDASMSLLAMVGIVLISKPSFIFGDLGSTPDDIVGVFFGLGAGIFAGVTIVIIRKLGKKTHASLNVLYYSLSGSILSIVIMLLLDSFTVPCSSELIYIFLLGITGGSAQVLMTIGLHYERANTFAVLRSFQIVFIFCLQTAILQDTPSLLSIIGASLIFLSVFSLAMRKAYNTTCASTRVNSLNATIE